MAKTPSKASMKLAAIILKGAGITAGAVGEYMEKQTVTILALQIDIAADLIKDGHLTRSSLLMALGKECLGLAGLYEDDRIKCGIAVILATKSSADLAEELVESGALDVATDGVAAPLTTPWLIASGAAALADIYAAYGECKPVVKEGVNAIGGVMDQMSRELTQWAIQKDMGFQ